MSSSTVVTDVRITPVAFADPPLLNSVGVHEPYALRSVIEVETASASHSTTRSWPACTGSTCART